MYDIEVAIASYITWCCDWGDRNVHGHLHERKYHEETIAITEPCRLLIHVTKCYADSTLDTTCNDDTDHNAPFTTQVTIFIGM